tara:strand:- start:1136 stop:2185 length:1050 start_codon:yes stop_codon:yes gene_type:complete
MIKINKLVKIFFLVFLAVNINVSYSQSEGEERVGQAGAYELLINPWARSSGLASANTASIRGVESVFLNVAGLTGTNSTEVMFSHASWFADISISSFAVGQKVGDTGVMGISFMSLDFGEIVRTTEQNPNGGLGTFSPQFMNVGLSFAKKFTNRISGGVTLRLISESAAEIAANGFSFDTGIHYETGSRNQAKFGIALKNVGTGMAFNGDGDDVTLMGESYESTFEIRSENFELPALLHIGGSYDFLFNDIHTVMLCLNFTSNSFSKDQFLLGTEYSYKDYLALRFGYTFEDGIFDDFNQGRTTAFTGLSSGFSFEIPISGETSFSLDYSFRAANPLSSVHTLGARIDL